MAAGVPKKLLLTLDRGQHDVMGNLAHAYPTQAQYGGLNAAGRLRAQGVRTDFHNNVVGINPSFAMFSDKELWESARKYKKVIADRDSAADGLGGQNNRALLLSPSSNFLAACARCLKRGIEV